MAEAIGSSKAHVWEMETGKNKNPSANSLSKLADHFDVSVGYLLGESLTRLTKTPRSSRCSVDSEKLSDKDREVVGKMIKMFYERGGGKGGK